MSGQLLVSIIIPMYNVELYVESSIRSALNQTYKQIEIIAVNDGSSDATRVIAEQIMSDDSRVIIVDQTNQGLSAARNAGISHASGDYLLFLDSDDMLPNIAVETLVRAANDTGAEIVSARLSDAMAFKEAVVREEFHQSALFKQATIEDFYYQKHITNHSCGKLFSRALFSKTDIHFPIGRTYEDIATTYKLMAIASNIMYTNSCLYYYRPNEKGISRVHTLKSIEDLELDYSEIKHSFGSKPSRPQLFYLQTILYTLLRNINKAPKQEELSITRKRVESEYDRVFRISTLNFSTNMSFSIKLLTRRFIMGKMLLRGCRK